MINKVRLIQISIVALTFLITSCSSSIPEDAYGTYYGDNLDGTSFKIELTEEKVILVDGGETHQFIINGTSWAPRGSWGAEVDAIGIDFEESSAVWWIKDIDLLSYGESGNKFVLGNPKYAIHLHPEYTITSKTVPYEAEGYHGFKSSNSEKSDFWLPLPRVERAKSQTKQQNFEEVSKDEEMDEKVISFKGYITSFNSLEMEPCLFVRITSGPLSGQTISNVYDSYDEFYKILSDKLKDTVSWGPDEDGLNIKVKGNIKDGECLNYNDEGEMVSINCKRFSRIELD